MYVLVSMLWGRDIVFLSVTEKANTFNNRLIGSPMVLPWIIIRATHVTQSSKVHQLMLCRVESHARNL